MTRRPDVRVAALVSVLMLCSTLGLMFVGAPALMVWCFVAATAIAAVRAMVPQRW